MRVMLALLLAGVSRLSTASDELFSFKEIPLNSNIEIVNSYSQVLCKELPEEKRVLGDKECLYIKPGPYGQLDSRIATFGGAPVNAVIMTYVANTLKAILVSVNSADYTQVVDALKEKYGTPKTQNKEVLQTKAGAT